MTSLRFLLHSLLALALLVAPLASNAAPIEHHAAMDAIAGDAAHAQHEHHDTSAPVPSKPAPCDQHADCDGLCCAACAHCATAALARSTPTAYFRPIQTPAEPHLHSTLVVSSPSRPPQAV